MSIRQSMHQVPQHHSQLKDRFYGQTPGGTDFALRYSAGTTNDRAIDMMQRRIEAAAEARRNNRPLGIYTGPTEKQMGREERVDILTQAGGQKFVMKVDVVGGNNYKVEGRFFDNLRDAVAESMEKFEASFGYGHGERAPAGPPGMRF